MTWTEAIEQVRQDRDQVQDLTRIRREAVDHFQAAIGAKDRSNFEHNRELALERFRQAMDGWWEARA